MNVEDLADLLGITKEEMIRRLEEDDVISLDLKEDKKSSSKEEGKITVL